METKVGVNVTKTRTFHPVKISAKVNTLHGPYIGRKNSKFPDSKGEWGNPFMMKDQSDAERKLVVDQHKHFIYTKCVKDEKFIQLIISTFKGRYPICFCFPKACHGDILVEIANDPISVTLEKIKLYFEKHK